MWERLRSAWSVEEKSQGGVLAIEIFLQILWLFVSSFKGFLCSEEAICSCLLMMSILD